MAAFIITISGVSPLLLHRFSESGEVQTNTRTVHLKQPDPREMAEAVAYRSNHGALYFPGTAISRLLREAGSGHKQRGSRKSLKFIVSSAILVLEDQIILRDAEGEPLRTFEVDSRPVVIPSTKGRVMRHRPRLNSWHAEFSIEVDEAVMDADTVHQLLSEGGLRLGVGDFRPEKGGPFGRFHVTRWQQLAQQQPQLAA